MFLFLEKLKNKDMKESPLVSVVIPCYNHENYVQESLRSVIDQTYENIELIIIDDGSKDTSVEKIKEIEELCKSRFVRFEFRTRSNKGLCPTLNEGFAWCRGKYICILASDDAYLPNKTQIQVDYLENTTDEIKGVFGGINFVDEYSHITQKYSGKERKYDFKDIFLHNHILMATTNMIKSKFLSKIVPLPEELIIDDWYMWLKLTEHGGYLKQLKYVFTNYRRHSLNLSGTDKQSIIKMNIGRKQVIDYFKENPLYEKAVINILWLNFTNCIIYKVDRKEAMSSYTYIAKKDFKFLFSIKAIKFYVKLLLIVFGIYKFQK